MPIATYRVGQKNQTQMIKTGLDKLSYQIEFGAGVDSTDSVSSVTTTATDDAGTVVTANCVQSTTNSGTVTTVQTKTFGSGGTGTATDGKRFVLLSSATLASGKILYYQAFFIVRNKTYAPTPV